MPTPDQTPPGSDPGILKLLAQLATIVQAGGHVAVHCRAGQGRSPAFAAAVMVMSGFTADDAMAALSQVRGLAVPHRRAQRDWVRWVDRKHGSDLR